MTTPPDWLVERAATIICDGRPSIGPATLRKLLRVGPMATNRIIARLIADGTLTGTRNPQGGYIVNPLRKATQ